MDFVHLDKERMKVRVAVFAASSMFDKDSGGCILSMWPSTLSTSHMSPYLGMGGFSMKQALVILFTIWT